MAQFQWTVLGVTGKKYEVGLYHGDKSGHLLVHCNGNIVLTEFHVQETKNYSFFLDDELYELLVEKKEPGFAFSLTPNKTADTPMNRRIWEHDRKNLLKSIAFFAGMFLIVFGIVNAMSRYKSKQKTPTYDNSFSIKKQTTVRILIDSSNFSQKYFYVAEAQPYSGDIGSLSLKNSPLFPIQSGDEFVLNYAQTAPANHEILWQQPTETQIKKYRSRTEIAHQKANPNYSQDKVFCEMDLAFQVAGERGLAQLFYQSTDVSENAVFNKISYQKFIRDEPFRKLAAEHCWH